jgi:pSer/pThr/pTyr-binding forkhead associated (FHA) protein
VPELILSLRERELARFSVVALRTTIGRDPGCDVAIDNAGVSRLHAAIEVIGDSFVLRDCESQNGITLNGEPCREGRLVHGDMIGLNKFLLRFSNETLDIPANLHTEAEKPRATLPKDVQRTMYIDSSAAQALAESAKLQIARQRAELAARGGDSLPPAPRSLRARPRDSLRWEEPARSGWSLALIVGGLLVAAALMAGLLSIAF